MKLTKPIIILASVCSGLISTALYGLLIPWLNSGAECPPFDAVRYPYGPGCSLLGFHIPEYMMVVTETVMPISIPFGCFVGCAVGLGLLVLEQMKSSAPSSEMPAEE